MTTVNTSGPAVHVEPRPLSLTVGSERLCLVGDEWGAPSGPAVLLLHATGRSRHMWREPARRLAADGLRVVSIDMRGHGDSAWSPSADYSVDAFVSDVLAVIEELGPFHAVAGTSLGAMVAMATARVSAAVESVILLDAEPAVESLDMHGIRRLVTRGPHGFGSPDEVRQELAGMGLSHIGRTADRLVGDLREDELGHWHWRCDPAVLDIGQRPLGRARRTRIAQALVSVTVPVLVVRGIFHRPSTLGGARWLASLPVTAELVDLTSRDRTAEAAEVLARGIADFVRRRRVRAASTL